MGSFLFVLKIANNFLDYSESSLVRLLIDAAAQTNRSQHNPVSYATIK
jgi:hypothetical protein